MSPTHLPLVLPETDAYIERELVRTERGDITGTFIAEGKVALRRNWLLLIYLGLLMAGFNFMVGLSLL
jgi:SHS family lactate transporter-like MFS transporter